MEKKKQIAYFYNSEFNADDTQVVYEYFHAPGTHPISISSKVVMATDRQLQGLPALSGVRGPFE